METRPDRCACCRRRFKADDPPIEEAPVSKLNRIVDADDNSLEDRAGDAPDLRLILTAIALDQGEVGLRAIALSKHLVARRRRTDHSIRAVVRRISQTETARRAATRPVECN